MLEFNLKEVKHRGIAFTGGFKFLLEHPDPDLKSLAIDVIHNRIREA